MYRKGINNLIIDCSNLSSSMSISYGQVAPGFVFSNTGRRNGVKYFSITLPQLISVVKDIISNIDEFKEFSNYDENKWRNLFQKYITDNVVNALSATQTLPVFSLLNKVITIVNDRGDKYLERTILLDDDALRKVVQYLESQMPDNDEYILKSTENYNPVNVLTGINKIFYGAPGTGKSHRINGMVGCSKCVRTVFYPDMLYSDFVGGLRPRTIVEQNGIKKVIYEYRAGPFLRALIMALNMKDENIFLVIEEINRAAASAVFGELFQLLDRNGSGESKYTIDIIDPDMLDYINDNINEKITTLKIPNNLTILATMNSSDQAVMPLDTAFKRRWQFEYLIIDYNKATKGIIPVNLFVEDSVVELVNINWSDFSKIINNKLKELKIPEDRLLGHRFLNEDELRSPDVARNTLAGKLLIYLWDDVLRHGKKNVIFRSEEFNTYGDLYSAFMSGKPIFNQSIEESIKSTVLKINIMTE